MLNRLRSFFAQPKVMALGIVILFFTLPVIYMVQPLIGTVASDPAPSVDPSSLKDDVVHLAGASRVYNDRPGLDAVAAWIHGRFEACGARVQDQIYGVQGKSYRNVVADFGPATGLITVVGAHYDTCGAHPGADDNASGIAGAARACEAPSGSPARAAGRAGCLHAGGASFLPQLRHGQRPPCTGP